LLTVEFIIIFVVNNYLFLTMHSNVTIKNVSWPITGPPCITRTLYTILLVASADKHKLIYFTGHISPITYCQGFQGC